MWDMADWTDGSGFTPQERPESFVEPTVTTFSYADPTPPPVAPSFPYIQSTVWNPTQTQPPAQPRGRIARLGWVYIVLLVVGGFVTALAPLTLFAATFVGPKAKDSRARLRRTPGVS